MGKVRIVGGGLTGVLAAFEARRLGAQDVELVERFDELGGELLPLVRNGLELRDRCFHFGGPEDPARRVLEWGGARFQDFEAGCGALSPRARGGPTASSDIAPLVQTSGSERRNETLADCLRALPADLEEPLSRYCQWRLCAWLDEAHASVAVLLGVACEPAPAAGLASTPRDGFADLFRTCRRGLEALGVSVRCGVLASPRELLAGADPEDVIVWAADPWPLFAAFDLAAPKRLAPQIAAYVYKARLPFRPPFVLRNFASAGSVFRVQVYECRGESLASVECVAETPDADLRKEVHRLMADVGGEGLVLGDCLAADLRTATNCLSMDAWRRLKVLRARTDDRLVVGPWQAHGAAGRLAELQAALARALAPRHAAAA